MFALSSDFFFHGVHFGGGVRRTLPLLEGVPRFKLSALGRSSAAGHCSLGFSDPRGVPLSLSPSLLFPRPHESEIHKKLGIGFGAVCWFWIFYRAKEDGAVVLGLKHPWEH